MKRKRCSALVWDFGTLHIGERNDIECPSPGPGGEFKWTERKARLLVVEDRSSIREELRAFLGSHYEVIGLPIADLLPEKIEAFGPDLIILDVELPSDTGCRLCRMIRSIPKYQHMRVLFLTGAGEKVAFEGPLDADAYLAEPFEPKQLAETIQRLIH